VLFDHYRKNLREVVGGAATPYGYTLSIWAAGATLVSVHGLPTTLAALTFVAGAVLGFTFAPRKGPSPPLGKPSLRLCGDCDRSSGTYRLLR
jgi:hypothetical protein